MLLTPQPSPFPQPVWQTSPVLKRSIVNQNLLRNDLYKEGIKRCIDSGAVVIGRFDVSEPGYSSSRNPLTSFYSTLLSIAANETVKYEGDPMTTVYFPVFDSFNSSRKPVAVIIDIINWASYFRDILPPNVNGVDVVLENSCSGTFTYVLNGESVSPIGNGDLHQAKKFDDLERTTSFGNVLQVSDGSALGLDLDSSFCSVMVRVYPSQEYYDGFISSSPSLFTFYLAIIFVFSSGMFCCYDKLVGKRQRILWTRATQSTSIVTSLFPRKVRDRLMNESSPTERSSLSHGRRLSSDCGDTLDDTVDLDLEPIADHFDVATVAFGDIAGFTEWSASREPKAVFHLLQTVYHAFDKLAKQHNVWKVETIGDSYMAVTGVPNPQEKHAEIMVQYCSACLFKMKQLTRDLEVELGEGTADLTMRFGIHSGPVTAGVLRGERARFQLFGGTVNFASRMESTGVRSRIQCSEATAELLAATGKAQWLVPRQDPVFAKGLGTIQTFFVVDSPLSAPA